MDEDMYPNFETLCRLCLRSDTATVKIFKNDPANNQPSIPVRIMACAALEVLSTDGLPKSICAECRYQLEKSYYFRKRCQLSDSKLKKHMRMLNLGKKSSIFNRTEDEDFEEELEFEESLNFLKEKDAEVEKEKALENKNWKEEVKEALRIELRDEVESRIRLELEESVREDVRRKLKTTLRNEIRAEMRDDLIAKLREEVRQECIQVAKAELEEEVRLECIIEAKAELEEEVVVALQEHERKNLLNDLEEFLNGQRGSKYETHRSVKHYNRKDPLFDEVELPVHSKVEDGKHIENSRVEKLLNDSLLQSKAKKTKYDTQATAGTSDHEISSTEQTSAYADVALSEQEEGPDDTDSNYYIVEGGDESVDQEEDENEDKLFSYDDSVNFQITPSDSSDFGSTTYQIEESCELRLLKKETTVNATLTSDKAVAENNDDVEDEDVLIYDPEIDDDDDNSRCAHAKEQDKCESQRLTVDKISNQFKVESSIKKTISSLAVVISSQSGSSAVVDTTEPAKNFQCSECPRVFTRQVSMLRHMEMHRELEKRGVSYSCPICHINLSCKSALNRHMLKHSGQRPHVCNHCGKAFIQREILKRHLFTHTGVRPYDCPHCDRSFSQKLNLTQHINSCHSENPRVQQYGCHMCPKRFNHASGLSRHLATHSGVSYQCTKCDRTFTDRSSVKRHIVHVHGIDKIGKLPKHSNTETNR